MDATGWHTVQVALAYTLGALLADLVFLHVLDQALDRRFCYC